MAKGRNCCYYSVRQHHRHNQNSPWLALLCPSVSQNWTVNTSYVAWLLSVAVMVDAEEERNLPLLVQEENRLGPQLQEPTHAEEPGAAFPAWWRQRWEAVPAELLQGWWVENHKPRRKWIQVKLVNVRPWGTSDRTPQVRWLRDKSTICQAGIPPTALSVSAARHSVAAEMKED